MTVADPTWLATAAVVVAIIGVSWALARGVGRPRPPGGSAEPPVQTPSD